MYAPKYIFITTKKGSQELALHELDKSIYSVWCLQKMYILYTGLQNTIQKPPLYAYQNHAHLLPKNQNMTRETLRNRGLEDVFPGPLL